LQFPDVTRERMYLDTLQSVLGQTPKVLMDTGTGGNNVMYLPLDKWINKSGSLPATSSSSTTVTEPNVTQNSLTENNNAEAAASTYPNRPTYSSNKQGE
jgi:membrane protease subunit HflK